MGLEKHTYPAAEVVIIPAGFVHERSPVLGGQLSMASRKMDFTRLLVTCISTPLVHVSLCCNAKKGCDLSHTVSKRIELAYHPQFDSPSINFGTAKAIVEILRLVATGIRVEMNKMAWCQLGGLPVEGSRG